jgi:hypothetical protein
MRQNSYRVNRLIQDLNADPDARVKFHADPSAFFGRYDVTAAEQKLLSDGSIEAMGELGVHPNLQMKWLQFRPGATRSGPGPLASYLDKLLNQE